MRFRNYVPVGLIGISLACCGTPAQRLIDSLPQERVPTTQSSPQGWPRYEVDAIFAKKYDDMKKRLREAVDDGVVSRNDLREYQRFFYNLDETSPKTREIVLKSMDAIIETKYRIDASLRAVDEVNRQFDLPANPDFGGMI